ncbi:MAG: rhomboid family intramembrane serine protease [Bacteroidia bacterium]|nr:rhomboid family intramembrane serine protease [Bacteroidia bacterium]
MELLSAPITLTLVVITVITSLRGFQDSDLMYKFMFTPYRIAQDLREEWSRFFSHGLIHADGMHLAFNMIALYSFGGIVESMLGSSRFLLLYLFSLLTSGLPDYFTHRNNPGYRALGASGAVSAILLSAVIFDPFISVSLFFLPGIPGWIFALLYMGYSFYASRYAQDNIGHNAHLWGAVSGIVLTLLMEPSQLGYLIRIVQGG